MPQCAVATCRNSHRRTRGRRIRYHRFPQIPEVRSRWVRACGRTPLANGDIPFNIQTARICSLHFSNDSYEKDMEHLVLGLPVRSRLRRGAVPTIGVPVEVQPVTKMLVENAKRNLLKSAHYKMLGGEKKGAKNGGLSKAQQKKLIEMEMMKAETPKTPTEKEMTGIDILLALGLKPTAQLNKMHAIEAPGLDEIVEPQSPSTIKVETILTEQSPRSPTDAKVPQKQHNNAALPEETASIATNSHKEVKSEQSEPENDTTPKLDTSRMLIGAQNHVNTNHANGLLNPVNNSKNNDLHKRHQNGQKRRLAQNIKTPMNLNAKSNGLSTSKKMCLEQREQFIISLMGVSADKYVTVDQLSVKADQLKSEIQDLDELARAKEMEWNEILSMRKLKEEAYLRIERRRQIMGFLDHNNQSVDLGPPASLALKQHYWERSSSKAEQQQQEINDSTTISRREGHSKSLKNSSQNYDDHRKHIHENGSKFGVQQNSDQRFIGEGRQGPTVDVKSIIADYRLAHPDAVPKRRGRRTRNSVNIGLGAGGAMLENVASLDSRPSSTDSCKSGTNADGNQSTNFKDVLVQFAKLSQQQGEPTKAHQNYPDVTLHPVAATPPQSQIPTPQVSGSLLHGILTNSPRRPSKFSPTLARLLTAPERERNSLAMLSSHRVSMAAKNSQQSSQNNHSGVSISDYLSSSKGRTEITITPVVNMPNQNNSNNLINIDDNEDEASIIQDSRHVSRDGRDERESSPRCQGCHERTAQFVCAGCGNQWYCSRECQVAAWEDHSEICSG